jgi:predicted O-methyltransferase YrrM
MSPNSGTTERRDASAPRDAGALVEQMTQGFAFAQVMHTAVRSGIVDVIAAQPSDASTVAQRVSGDSTAVPRLLRGLVVLGLATVDDDERFSATPRLAAFATDHPGSLRDAVLFFGGIAYQAWGELTAAVLSGESPVQRAIGRPIWEHLAANPEDASAFDATMRVMSLEVQQALAHALEIAGASVVIDIGGGVGHVVASLLDANPAATGIVYEQPRLEREAASFLRARGLADRCRFVGGDFFESVPRGGDVHLLKWILHDWPDDDCRRILRASREAIAPDGRLVIVERVLPEPAGLTAGPSAALPVMFDLMMLACCNYGDGRSGRERTDAEYAGLLEAAGFSLHERIPLADGFLAFVASPV